MISYVSYRGYISGGGFTEKRILIITSKDRIITKKYENHWSLQDAVNGYPELCGTETIPVMPIYANGKEELPVLMYCNNAFALSDDARFDKINAAGCLLCEKEIRGDLAIVVDIGRGFERGFEYAEEIIDGMAEELPCECYSVKSTLSDFIKSNRKRIKELHEKFDNNKEAPTQEVIARKVLELSLE